MNKQYYYSPIAVDMGAKNTGVYMPQYVDDSNTAISIAPDLYIIIETTF